MRKVGKDETRQSNEDKEYETKERGKIQIKVKYNSSTKATANVLSVQQRKWPTDIKWMKDLLVVYSRKKVSTENICPVIWIRFGDQLAQVHRGDYVSVLCEKGRSDKMDWWLWWLSSSILFKEIGDNTTCKSRRVWDGTEKYDKHDACQSHLKGAVVVIGPW